MTYSRPLMSGLAVFAFCLLSVVWGLHVEAQVSCPDTYIPSRFLIGSEGRVVLEGGANNVRDAAVSTGNKIGQLPPGSTFTVVDGPVCGEGHTWVKVDNHAGLIGWTVEIINGRYGLEPNVTLLPPATFGPGSVDYAGIHFELDPNLATQVEASFVISEGFMGATLPPHIKFVFTPADTSRYQSMETRVLSAQSFNNQYLTSVPRLQRFLADPNTGSIPSEMDQFASSRAPINQHAQQIPFGSGQAYRGFTSIWQDGVNPSDFLIYAAHGLSSDGLYYIQASFITYYYDLSIYEPPPGEREDVIPLLEEFHANINNTINAARDEDFTPRPSQVDALLASFTIAPGTLSEVIAQAGVVAPHVAPTQDALFFQQTQQANDRAATSAAQTATQNALAPAFTATQAFLAPFLTATADAQCGILDSRLQVGQYARQTMSGNSSLRVRDSAGGTVIPETFLFPGDVVMVLQGPVCVDEVNWWQVRSDAEGWTGWIAESKDDNYYVDLIPPTPTPYPTRVPDTPIPDYNCTYRPNSGDERAYLSPDGGGEWQYYLFYEVYKAIGRYTDFNGETWYLFSPTSRLYGFADGGGMIRQRSFWGANASGSGCDSLPDVSPSFIERTFD